MNSFHGIGDVDGCPEVIGVLEIVGQGRPFVPLGRDGYGIFVAHLASRSSSFSSAALRVVAL